MNASRTWLSARQVAEQAGCNPKIVLLAITERRLPAIQTATPHGPYRVRSDHAEAFVDAYRAQHPQEAAT